MKYYNIFPTTICTFKSNHFNKNLKSIANEHIKDDKLFSDSMEALNNKNFIKIKKEILSKAKLYSKKFWGLDLQKPKIACSWFNRLKQNQGIGFHKHMHSYISGVYYLSGGSEISFLNSSEPSGVLPDVINYKNNYQFSIKPKKGLCILFPSSLQHCVNHIDEKPRYSLAFNITPTGKVGPDTGIIHIK